MRAALRTRVSAVGQPLGALYSNALIASDVDATELHLRPFGGETTIVLDFRFKCYSQRAASDFSVILFLHYEEHLFGSLFAAQYWRTADIAFAPSSGRVPLFRPLPGSTLPHIRTALSTTLPPPGLNLSLTPGSQGQFSGSALSSSSRQASPAPFGHPSRLTDTANVATASLEQSQQSALVLSPGSPAALNASLQPLGAVTAAVEPVSRSRRRSGPAAAPSPTSHSSPHVQPVTAAAAVPQPSARAAPAVAPPQPSKQARLHAPPLPPDSSSVTERVTAFIPPAGAAASSTPAPGLATHPIALSREEYHA